MKKSLVQLAVNPFLHGTASTQTQISVTPELTFRISGIQNSNKKFEILMTYTLYMEAVTTVRIEHKINQIGGGTKVNPA